MSSSGRADFGCHSWRLHAGKFAVMHLQAHACGQVIFSNEATGEPLGAMVLAVNDYGLPSGTWWAWYRHQGYSLVTWWEVWDLPPTLNSGRMCADPETVAVLPLGGASAFWHHRPYAIMALHRKKVYTSGHTHAGLFCFCVPCTLHLSNTCGSNIHIRVCKDRHKQVLNMRISKQTLQVLP